MVAFLVVTGMVAAVAFWAGSNVAAPAAVPERPEAMETYAVQAGSVGRSLRLPVMASWQAAGALRAARGGILTSIVLRQGALVDAGTTVATIDLDPVVVAAGSVPMFRTLKEGESGPDVEQFQELLIAEGHLAGPADGRFAADTTAATKVWQQAIGDQPDGAVDPGSLVFVERMPARMIVTADVGDHIESDAQLLELLNDAPSFQARVSDTQRSDLVSGDSVTIEAPNGSTWHGTLGQFFTQEGMGFLADIDGVDCHADCGLIPLSGQTELNGQVVLVPETRGLIVPTSAIVRQPSGDFAVVLGDGSRRNVTIVTQANGMAVVDGLEPGSVVQLPTPPDG